MKTAPTPVSEASDGPLVGEVERAQLLAEARWQQAFEAADADSAGGARLAQVPAGAEVTVYLGSWCGDSVRELTRLWRALDTQPRPPPFHVRYVAVDRQKQAPALPADLLLQRVPTFVVLRNGREVGRIVEHAPRGIATELAEFLERP